MSFLEPEGLERLTEMLRNGVPRRQALESVGIDRKKYIEWRRQAEAGLEPYATLFQQMSQCEATAEKQHVEAISETKDWRAHAWLLERQHPDRYGQKVSIDVSHEIDRVLKVAEKVLPEEHFHRLIDALADGESGEAVSEPAQEQAPSVH